MKKYLILVPFIVMLTACGSMFSPTDPYAKRAEEEREHRVKANEKILNKAPDWYTKIPSSNSAVYEAGFGSAYNASDAIAYAKNDAYGKLCMTAGGKTSSQIKTYSLEGETSRAQTNERVIKSFCPNVDLTGVEQKDVVRFITPNGKVNVYVLVVLPTGDANILRTAKDQRKLQETAEKRAPEAFKEIQ
ncbi:MAG: hypothetical protein RLZZ196_256 [Bacteroidota bacterium]|jgi:hypothetical protein